MNLQTAYDRDTYLEFLRTFVPGFKEDIRSAVADKLQVTSKAYFLGESEDLDLSVFEITHSSSTDARVSLSMDGFKLMKTSATYRALIVYRSENSEDWRFSLMTATPDLDEKGKVVRKLSNPRRFSFFLGPNAKINTPKRFLIKEGPVSDFADLQNRFSLEVVNKEFYKQISEKFTQLVGGTLGPGKKQKTYEPLIKLPSQSSKSQENMEFGVRLIGRIIFCWFLREKKSKNNLSLMPVELLSSGAVSKNSHYYHSILEPIFFEVLNKEQRSRREEFSGESYSLIPYLNGGLFSPHKDDYYQRPNGEQSIFHNTLVIPDAWLKELFEILETYNFTIDENTSFDEELSIDPEMLGRIFENLLAEINPETGESARKSTGSYYTPRVIVDYMVDESLLLYLQEHTKIPEEKLRAVVSYDLSDDAEYKLTEEEKKLVVQSLGKLKLLDPACGSGAFPIGALQKIVFILQQVDPDGKHWLQKQLENAHPEFRRDIEKKFSNRELDFLRKLGIIRECIFGVDIQPIATEIARLRCFLTLIVDERIDDKAENRGIKPLPNLDFKFVTANSLINLPKLEESIQSAMFDDQQGISDLKTIRDQYFNAYGLEREQLKTEFITAQKRLVDKLVEEHGYMGVAKAELTQKLTSWEPFSHSSSGWFDPEWMFGISDGFNIVIANPPYVDSESMAKNYSEQREKYKDIFETTKGNWDLFVPFIERGFNLINKVGYLSYIIPNKLIAAKYAIVLREFISTKMVSEIRDYSRLPVFVEADVYPVTLTAGNSSPNNDDKTNFATMGALDRVKFANTCNSTLLKDHSYWDIFFYEEKIFKLLIKLLSHTKLKKNGVSLLGAATVDEAYKIKNLICDSEDTNLAMKMVNTGTIDKYQSLWGVREMQYLKQKYKNPIVKKEDIQKLSSTRLSQAESRKIIIAGMSNKIEAYYDDGEYLAGKSTSIILGEREILLTLIGILNSKLVDFFVNQYFKSLKMSGGYININKDVLENIPIATRKNVPLLNLVSKMNQSPDNNTKQRIDQMVYELYKLTPEEIEIVESSSK